MKLKIVTIDLELSKTQRMLIGLGLISFVGLSGATLALAAPKVFTSGETLTAADLNASFGDLDTRTSALETTLAPTGALATTNLTASGNLTVAGTADIGLHIGSQCTYVTTPNSNFTDCSCAANEVAISGGGFCNNAGGDSIMMENRNPGVGTPGKTWRITCVDGTSHARFAALDTFAVCARLKSN